MSGLKPSQPGALMPMPEDSAWAETEILRQVRFDDGGCWLWQGASSYEGYGSIGLEGRTWRVHRLMFALRNGPIPDGNDLTVEKRFVLHKCDTPACCNPHHLYVGSAADNGRDMSDRCRCRIGHRVSYLRGSEWSKSRAKVRTGKVHWAIRGEVKTLFEWAQQFDIHPSTLDQRLQAGWRLENLADRPGAYRPLAERYYRAGREQHVRLSGIAAAEQYRTELKESVAA